MDTRKVCIEENLMEITVVSYYTPPVDRIGAGVQMHMIANAYARLGHSVTLVTPNAIKPTDSLYKLATCQISGSYKVVKWSLMLKSYGYPDGIVHFGGDNHFVRRQNSLVRLRTFHGSCFAEAKTATLLRDKLRMVYLGLTELIGQACSDVSTAVSADTNRYFPKPNVVIPNGVDLSAFTPSIQSKSKNPSILFIGMLDSRKRGRELLDVFSKQIRTRIPNAELWIVRDSTPLNVPGVTVFGSVSQELLIQLYQSAWCFCLPSLYEGFGVPYIEAMACGTPVVASPNPGALEVTKDGQYGLIANLPNLGDELIRLLDDTDLQKYMSDLALDYVQRFDIDKIAQRYLDLAKDTGRL